MRTANDLLAIAALGAMACGGGAPSLDELPDEALGSLCEGQVRCGQFPDVETCKASIEIDLDSAGLQEDVDNGIVDYDGDAAERCLDLFGSLFTCEVQITGERLQELNEVCESIFEGSVPVGGACTEDEQCEGLEASCDVDDCPDECCMGTCGPGEPELIAEIGESCESARCVSGAYCEGETTSCAARVAVGGACGDFDACVDGALCDLDFGSGMGTCRALSAPGETCDPEGVFGISCLRLDNFCDPVELICAARLDVGASCPAGQSSCVGYAECEDGTCTARPGPGESCVVDGLLDCLGDLECVAGTCAFEDDSDMYCALEI